MGSYTLELRELIEQATQFEEMSHTERIVKGRANLFNFSYPIFDEAYRNVFETNFIRNFYMREIGFETEGLFKFRLETWLNINMPYYNKLFESELIEFDPLESYNLKTIYLKKNDSQQNEVRDKLQNDNKNISSLDTTVNQGRESEMRSQNDTSDKLQNDNESNLQNDNREISKNDKNLLEQNSTTNNTTNDISKQKVSTTDNVDGTSKNIVKGQTDTNVKASEIENDFDRNLESLTPDSRLSITTENGKGVIEYASKILENTANNKKDNNSEGKTLEDSTTDLTTNNKSKNDVDGTNEFNGNTNAISKNEENAELISNIGDTFTGDNQRNLSSDINEKFNSEFDGSKNSSSDSTRNSNTDEALVSNVKDKASTAINDVEDYIESKVGSIGVKTYSEMIKEYRSILLRVERQIFDEMNELFMLVY